MSNENNNSELQERLVQVKRVAKVVKGGRIFNFTALVVVGDFNGRVGFGKAKAKEISLAMQKARNVACRNMFKVKLNNNTIFYPISIKYGATRLFLAPASEGSGIIASESVRMVLELAGVSDILSKTTGSRNFMNVVRAVFKALKMMKNPQYLADKRGKSVEQIIGEKTNER